MRLYYVTLGVVDRSTLVDAKIANVSFEFDPSKPVSEDMIRYGDPAMTALLDALRQYVASEQRTGDETV